VKDVFVRVLRARRIVAIVKLHLLNNLTYLLTHNNETVSLTFTQTQNTEYKKKLEIWGKAKRESAQLGEKF